MWSIYTDFNEYRPIGAFDSDYYFSKVKLDDIKKYLNEIEFRIYKRKVENISRSMPIF